MCNRDEFRFNVNQVVLTQPAAAALNSTQIYCGLQLHQLGDWGDVCEEDRLANEDALLYGGRLMSVYKTGTGVAFWIITEWDRSVTTVLLPERHEFDSPGGSQY